MSFFPMSFFLLLDSLDHFPFFLNVGAYGLQPHSDGCVYLSVCVCIDIIILHCMDTQFLPVGSPKVGGGEMVEDPGLGGQSM